MGAFWFEGAIGTNSSAPHARGRAENVPTGGPSGLVGALWAEHPFAKPPFGKKFKGQND